jgi:carboxymethylenebutenolidase
MCHAEAPSVPSPVAITEEVAIPLAGDEQLPALYAHPEPAAGATGPTRASGVLIVADVYGRTPFYEDLASRLAGAGFHALLPEPFFRQGPLANRSREVAMARRAQLDDVLTIAGYHAAIDWLRARPEITPGRVGTIGFCMGGTYVLDLAAERDDLATVCYYGFPRSRPQGPRPGPSPIDNVASMRGPIIGFWGDQDAGVGMENVIAFAEAAKEHGVDLDHTIYAGLGHGFLAQALTDPDHSGHDQARDSWDRTIGFYHRHLG